MAFGYYITVMTEDQEEIDSWFEIKMPTQDTQPLFDVARNLGVGFYLGYAEIVKHKQDVSHFNSSILDPPLPITIPGRAVFITSTAGQNSRAYWSVYAVSKCGLEMLVKTYAHEVEKTNINVNLFNPGGTRTNMRAEAFPGEDPMTLNTPDFVANQIVEMTLPSYKGNGLTVTALSPK